MLPTLMASPYRFCDQLANKELVKSPEFVMLTSLNSRQIAFAELTREVVCRAEADSSKNKVTVCGVQGAFPPYHTHSPSLASEMRTHAKDTGPSCCIVK
jgi:hypothetical protein